jgi:type III pantothenate kinase
MILEVDCGNTLLKWRVLDGDGLSVKCKGSVLDEAGLLTQLHLNTASIGLLRKCRMVSVRSDAETNSLVAALRLQYSIPVVLASSSKVLSGVTNGYHDYKLLGTDRWLAILGAFALKQSACLVLDIGTAVTADFVDATGMHLGGFICPGIKMMRTHLGLGTARVAYLAEDAFAGSGPGHTTAEAVERGTELMLLGFVGLQVNKAQDLWGAEFSVLLTGGDAGLVKAHFDDAIAVPDLVFRGLALACPD